MEKNDTEANRHLMETTFWRAVEAIAAWDGRFVFSLDLLAHEALRLAKQYERTEGTHSWSEPGGWTWNAEVAIINAVREVGRARLHLVDGGSQEASLDTHVAFVAVDLDGCRMYLGEENPLDFIFEVPLENEHT